ncbi:hypothetical protein [Planctomyces sp. SH-PL62]|uniref:hypothetical protein n=1 Tax=Planctomyces sp. SH-PL62 TaxID=1636152 RepID=UPI00078DC2B5|nr:hypothetical protein [Planctomyces sp. SH-PL62]AMV39975.1 hypothetical protein VT85_21255 [Planctomyces sp. SH-PL62]
MSDTACSISLPLVRPTLHEAESRRSLPELIGDLLGCFAQLKAPRRSAKLQQSVNRYRDADFNYLEVVLPGLDGVEADICIHDGCVYVRVMR